MNDSKNLWTRFLLAWILANGFGWFSISAIYILPYWGPWATFGVSTVLSLFQWIVLQKYFEVDFTWLWVSPLVYGFFLYFLFSLKLEISSFAFIILNIICLGFLGLLQRYALDYYIDNATAWIFVSPFACAISMFIAREMTNLFAHQSFVAFWTSSGILYGFITGISTISIQGSSSLNRPEIQ